MDAVQGDCPLGRVVVTGGEAFGGPAAAEGEQVSFLDLGIEFLYVVVDSRRVS